MPVKHSIKININQVGPLKISPPFQVDCKKDIRLAIYAPNGSGKTFFSRCFAEVSRKMNDEEAFYAPSKLVSLSEQSASFYMDYKEKHTEGDVVIKERKCEIKCSFSKTADTVLNNKEAPLLHVFNSDYIRKNFIDKRYSIDGEIAGDIIIGEDNAGIEEKKQALKKCEEDNIILKDFLESNLEKEKGALQEKYNISKILQKYKELNFEKLFGESPTVSNLSDLDTQYINLKNFEAISDTFEPIQRIGFSVNLPDLDPIKTVLLQPYDKKVIKEAFIEKIKLNRDFIKKGLDITKNNVCPYCEQSLSNANELITAYNDFFDETQKTVENSLTAANKGFADIYDVVNDLISNSTKAIKTFNKWKSYFSSTNSLTLNPISLPDSFEDNIALITTALENKAKDISKIDFDIDTNYKTLQKHLETIQGIVVELNKTILILNDARDKADKILKSIKEDICVSFLVQFISDNQTSINAFSLNKAKIKTLNEEINKLKGKMSKKDVIYESFCNFMRQYFDETYTVDKDTFALKANEGTIDADAFLSDGEKSIISFCYFLAELHKKINSVDDYSNVFFVIDDPVSSLDFNFVYTTANIIKNISSLIKENIVRLFILTHNADFMNLIIGNNVVKTGYIFRKGQTIKPLKSSFVAPYEEHLQDVYNVSNGSPHSHTTCNSVRHILENIASFKYPGFENLEDIIKKEEIFDDATSYMKRIIQDMCHGTYRKYSEIDGEQIKKGCSRVIEYIRTNFVGQIEHIEKKS